MKKIILITSISAFFLTACGDEYADLRKMTVQDYLDNKSLLEEVMNKCHNREIKDEDICETMKEAINSNHDAW